MLEKVTMFELRTVSMRWRRQKSCPTANRTRRSYGLRREAGLDPLTCVALEDSVNGMVASKARGCAPLWSLLKKAA
jgi:sugar-phosphatase